MTLGLASTINARWTKDAIGTRRILEHEELAVVEMGFLHYIIIIIFLVSEGHCH